MKRIFVLIVAFCVLFCGCGAEDPQIDPNSVIIEIGSFDEKSVSYTVINNSKNVIELGSAYSLEYNEGENWEQVPETSEVFFDMMAYVLNPEESKSFSENLEMRYGVLESGTYRIVKDIRILNEDGDLCGEQKAFGEFEIL